MILYNQAQKGSNPLLEIEFAIYDLFLFSLLKRNRVVILYWCNFETQLSFRLILARTGNFIHFVCFYLTASILSSI